MPPVQSTRLTENFEFFRNEIAKTRSSLKPLCEGLSKLMVVDIALSRDQDNPQLIFESMNSTGRELSQADLIRNFILMGLDHDHQTRLYDEHWRPMEVAFGQEAYVRHFDGFMRYFLTVKTGELPNIGRVYEVFKEYARRRMEEESLDDVLAELHRFAGYYCSTMELGQEKDPCLRAAFEDLRDLKANVAYPFLLHVYDDYMADLLTGKEMEEVVRLVESYVFRRAVCEIPTNSLNRTFESLMKVIDRDRYLESIKAALLLLPSYRRFPRDQEFRRELVKRDLYNFPRRSYWLRRLETHGRKEHVPVEEYTVEHIMPQNRNLSLAWREELGDEWEGIQGMWLHTLGNLTLTGYNAEYSDHSFSEKRDRTGGFSESPLRVNRGLGTVKRWNEEAIEARAHHAIVDGVWSMRSSGLVRGCAPEVYGFES